ncbi:MAG: (2Fe-2S)-binding protein [Burkholderiaceae bacterium]|nr:(2Fe-2S)-binding protein [Burkholderiaceae bacterium]
MEVAAMIVCVCRAVSDRQIRSSVRDGAQTMSQLRAELGVTACCGKCGPRVRELLDEHRAGEARGVAGLACACAAA